MITGGKIRNRIGRRRAFAVGLVVYAVGSLLSSIAPMLAVLTLGWSLIEGLRAALVLPARAALVGGNYAGRDRAMAYGVIGALTAAAQHGISDDPQISSAVSDQVGVAISGSLDFVPLEQAHAAQEQAGIPGGQIDAVLSAYADAQLFGLKVALLAAAAIALFSLFRTRRLPATRLAGPEAPNPVAAPGPAPEAAAGR